MSELDVAGMTKTIIDTPEQARQKIENIRNECARHCRIGKVKMKLLAGYGLIEFDVSTPDKIIRRLRCPIDGEVRSSMPWSGGYVHTTTAGDMPSVEIINFC